ncbi:multidrug MFS transporter [Virgibacillus sp. 7505]|uniref:sugar transferase n=1 Tax=Virgibacillus sp. 7505 TaxID=2022548 RepID=UPI000BA519BA|nr:sugar transferase [Virgibacillus sp. 7505]PAE17933.1 multidrug MFS transporter [Virgibacillus sp. 7505]
MAESKHQQLFDSVDIDNSIESNNKSYHIIKRSIDVSLSLIGITLLVPIFILIIFLIKMEDRKGSVIFKQERVGKNGRTFSMYKFRSMVSNAEDLLDGLIEKNEATGPLFKIKEDPRVTKVGRFIRRTSIDELPQLFNVLRGEMSLVGPRPALPREVKFYTKYERQRLNVKPGLTCLWQVNGRSNLGFNEQVELDLRYIKTKSILLDLKLIIKTFTVLIGSKDAY